MTRVSTILVAFVGAGLLIRSAGISANGAGQGGEATTGHAGEMAATARANSWIPTWFPKAPALPPPTGAVIRVATVEELLTAVDRVQPGGTILLAEGHYRLPRVLVLRDKMKITLRSASGDPARTILSGKGWDSQARGDDILHIARCEGVTIADLSFTDCRSYGIKVETENAPKDIHIYHCRFRDIGVRAIKGSAGKEPNVRAVKGSVRYCAFENTKIPPADWLFGGDYIAAIDMMALEDWIFSDNTFRNIKGRHGGGRAAIFIWVRSRRVVVERNLILDCDRGVAFGNPGPSTANLAGERPVDVADGIIRNNFIAGGPDCGIELWYADRLKVQHNSIWRPQRPRETTLRTPQSKVGGYGRPYGLIAAITPWNFPLALAKKIAPAPRAGNTIILKPSPYTPLATLRLGEIVRNCLPPVNPSRPPWEPPR